MMTASGNVATGSFRRRFPDDVGAWPEIRFLLPRGNVRTQPVRHAAAPDLPAPRDPEPGPAAHEAARLAPIEAPKGNGRHLAPAITEIVQQPTGNVNVEQRGT